MMSWAEARSRVWVPKEAAFSSKYANCKRQRDWSPDLVKHFHRHLYPWMVISILITSFKSSKQLNQCFSPQIFFIIIFFSDNLDSLEYLGRQRLEVSRNNYNKQKRWTNRLVNSRILPRKFTMEASFPRGIYLEGRE
jgi:hypothetical protein